MSNDFKAFADAAGANVLSQADYAALTALISNGFLSGVAQSVQINKVLRQATIGTYLLGQMMSDAGVNAQDNGDLTTLLAGLKTTLGGRLQNVSVYLTSGSFTAMASTKSIVIEALGGGGGGGGCPATSASQEASGFGGSSGLYAVARFTSGFASTLSVNVGAGGSGGPTGANPGLAGGASSVGTLLVAPGGSGGANGAASTASLLVFPTNQSPAVPTVTGGTLLKYTGSVFGSANLVLSLQQVLGGGGGDSPYGRGGRAVVAPNAGNPGLGYGAGGSGSAQQPSNAGQPGGAGTGGLVIIYEYN